MPGKRREWVKKIARWLFETPARYEIKSEGESQKVIAEDNSECNNKVVISLKLIPGLGKSATSLIFKSIS